MAAARDYGTTVLRAARHRHSVPGDVNTIALADELGKRPEIELVAVVDEDGRPRGLILREALFALLGKPFGREVLGRSKAEELAEPFPLLDYHTALFAAGATVAGSPATAGSPAIAGEASAYRVLVDADGRFRAALSMRDLAEHLSRITEDDIELAGRIQERLEAANEPIAGEGYRFEAWSRPAKGVGGDFWYSSRLEDGSAFLALCDVSGKGVAASLVVSLVWGMLRMYDFSRGLLALLVALNEAIVMTFHLEKYLTAFFCIFDPETGVLRSADMGHSHAFVLRDGKPRSLKSSDRNLPIGVEPRLEPVIYRWRLRPGDALVVYSDGITEQENEAGDEFGEGRFAAAALEAVRHGLPAVLDAHRGSTPQQDDMSFMMLRYSGTPESRSPSLVGTGGTR
jgi:sigma-B regulation protein RsbU (phosphoserine phosphatase)